MTGRKPCTMEIITIPKMFSRTYFCQNCHANRIPYNSSESLKRQSLLFVVKPGSVTDTSHVALRRQTKVGRVGFTPHIFYVEKELPGVGSEKSYNVLYACGIENCGMTIDDSDGPKTFDLVYREKTFTLSQLLHLYKYKDPAYMLDSKEVQEDLETYCARVEVCDMDDLPPRGLN